jgi:hypothetical protein
MEKNRLVEIFLVEVIFYFLLWLLNDYLATLLSISLGGIFLAILIISLIVEWIERSKVPIWYYKFMVVSILAPLLTAIVYLFFTGGVSWME